MGGEGGRAHSAGYGTSEGSLDRHTDTAAGVTCHSHCTWLTLRPPWVYCEKALETQESGLRQNDAEEGGGEIRLSCATVGYQRADHFEKWRPIFINLISYKFTIGKK